MKPRPLFRGVAVSTGVPGVTHRPLPTWLGVSEPTPDQPPMVVVAGPDGPARRDMLAALFGVPSALLVTPDDTFLVLRHADEASRAYVPGYRQPQPFRPDVPTVGPVLSRPPRRVEVGLSEPLLRHVDVVSSPDTGGLGVAGVRVLLDVVGRAGALLFVIRADQSFSAVELDVLSAVAGAGIAVFFVVTPPTGADGTSATESPVDPGAVAVAAHRVALLAAVPGLAQASWFRCPTGDLDSLRHALLAWASGSAGRRASRCTSDAGQRRIPVAAQVDPAWGDRLDRLSRVHAQRIRQHLALELANIHLRAVQEIVFGAGCAGLPRMLDREVHALSLLATAQCDEAVRWIVADAVSAVFDENAPGGTCTDKPTDVTLRRVSAAVREALADHPPGQGLERVLLITSTGGIAELSGAGALDALDSHPGAVPRDKILPPVAVALSGACYQHWCAPNQDDQGTARSWVQRVLREVEQEIRREVTRRFEAVRLALGAVLGDAVDHGILL